MQKIEEIYRYASNIIEMIEDAGYVTWWFEGRRLDITLHSKTVASWVCDGKETRRSPEYMDEPFKSEQDKWYGIFEPEENPAETTGDVTSYVAPAVTKKRRGTRKNNW